MYDIQQGIIAKLKSLRSDKFSTVRKENIKEYAGQLVGEEIKQATTSLPVIYVMPQPSAPLGIDARLNCDLIIMTSSKSFDKVTNTNTNMQLCQQIYTALDKSPNLTYNGVTYLLDRDALLIKTVAIDNKYTLVILQLEYAADMD